MEVCVRRCVYLEDEKYKLPHRVQSNAERQNNWGEGGGGGGGGGGEGGIPL